MKMCRVEVVCSFLQEMLLLPPGVEILRVHMDAMKNNVIFTLGGIGSEIGEGDEIPLVNPIYHVALPVSADWTEAGFEYAVYKKPGTL